MDKIQILGIETFSNIYSFPRNSYINKVILHLTCFDYTPENTFSNLLLKIENFVFKIANTKRVTFDKTASLQKYVKKT